MLTGITSPGEQVACPICDIRSLWDIDAKKLSKEFIWIQEHVQEALLYAAVKDQ